VQVTNTNISVWDKTPLGVTGCPDPLTNPLFTSDLNSFFGYVGPGSTTLFDPRVVHDDVYGRWVVTADAFPDSNGAQLQFIAVSTTEDATGAYLVTNFNTRAFTCPTCFWDFPQLGFDEDSVILTANIFNPGYVDSRWVFLNKARLYAGIGGSFGCFFFNFGTSTPSWAPPKAMDLNPITYMIEAPPSGAAVFLIGLSGTDRICPITQINQSVAVPAYSMPPNASQPGTTEVLDTLDSRFQNRSLQIGGDLWQAHSVADGVFADVQWIRINLNTTPRTLAQSGIYFTSGPSFDFNPAITANGAGNAALVYSSTNPTAGFQAEVRVAGKASAAGNFGPSDLAFRSNAPLTGNPQSGKQRWGDYSSVNVDPLNANRVWGVNETVDPSDPTPGNSWGTLFFNATFP
jgi:hypothetical protein